MVEFSDFPVEIHRMIVKRCDFSSRFNLRFTSKSMMQIVDFTKFYISELEIDVGKRLMRLRDRNSKLKTFKNKKAVGNRNGVEIAAKWMGSLLRNAEIGSFEFKNPSRTCYEFLRKFDATLKSPLKVTSVKWLGKTFSNFFDQNTLKRVVFSGDCRLDFTEENLEFFKNIDAVSIGFPIDVTDEYVLSMNSTQILLHSTKFTAEMINRLVEKFLTRGTIGSGFDIYNHKKKFVGKIRIPDGFVENPLHLDDYTMTVDGKFINLFINNLRVSFHIYDAGE